MRRSVGYLGQTGILPNADRQQFNARTNLDLKLNSRLTVRLNLAYIKNDYSDPISSYASGISETGDPNSAASSDQIIRQLNRIAPWIVGRAEDGTYGTIGDGNPLAWLLTKLLTVKIRISLVPYLPIIKSSTV